MQLPLSQIPIAPVKETKKKKGVVKQLSAEDRFVMGSIQSACHTPYVQNDYFLVCKLGYDGCTCCAGLPETRVPLTIVPLVNPNLCGFQLPEGGMMPHNLGTFTLQL